MTHRALLAAALASGPSPILRPLEADDTRVTREGMAALGLEVRVFPDRWVVQGRGGNVPGGGELFLEQSGTSLRFLVGLASLGSRPSRLDGVPRLRERPIRELAQAVQQLGGHVSLDRRGGGLPLEAGGAPVGGGSIALDSGRSSQFASALLLIGSRLPGGLELSLRRPVVSLPYVELTADVLREFGVVVERQGDLHWRVRSGDYPGRSYRVEGDHSSVAPLLAAAAVAGGKVRVEDVRPHSAQPDARLSGILDELGCAVKRGDDWVEVEGTGKVRRFDRDMSEAPDLVPTLAVLALFSDGPCTMRGIGHLRLKESDRLAVLAENLRALGRGASTGADYLAIDPPGDSKLRGGMIRTASDHRIAMAFAVAGLGIEGIAIDDADCVSKSYPGFWEQFRRLEGDVGGQT